MQQMYIHIESSQCGNDSREIFPAQFDLTNMNEGLLRMCDLLNNPDTFKLPLSQ